MAETIDVSHTTLSSGSNVITGEPISPIRIEDDDQKDLQKVLSYADDNMSRSVGGFFFDSIGNTFVAGFLTPRDSSEPGVRPGDYFYNVFECAIRDVKRLDLVSLRNVLKDRCVHAPDNNFSNRFDLPVNISMRAAPDNTCCSLQTIARIWDQLRREDGPARAKLHQVSFFKEKVRNSLSELSYIDTDSVANGHFAIQSGTPPEFDPGRQDRLLEFLQSVEDKRDGILLFTDLPDLETEYTIVFNSELSTQLDTIQEEVDYTTDLASEWEQFFEREVAPRIEEHLEAFRELQEANLDPHEDLESVTDTGSGFLLGLLSNDSDNSPVETRLEDEADLLIEEIRRAVSEQLLDRFEQTVHDQVNEMVTQSEKQAAEFKRSDIYQKYKNID